MPRHPQHWSPSTMERLRAKAQPVWRCKIHTKTLIVRHKDTRCEDCVKANMRRVAVIAWLKGRGLFQED